MPRAAIVAILLLACVAVAVAGRDARRRDATGLPSIENVTRGMELREGVLRLWIDAAAGKVWLEVPPPGDRGVAAELLYSEGLRTGLGSNPVGLDRGQLGETRWLALRRIGPRVLLEQLNPRFRATSDDPAERRAVRESFATSVLWASEIAALDADGRSLVDFSPFLVRDTHGVARALEASGQGSYAVDPERSVVNLDDCLAFPDNVELEATLTFSGSSSGRHVRETAPDAESITLVLHHSLIRLPDDGYRPRAFDPRGGSFAVEFQDYATDLDEPLRRRWIARHRLVGADPGAERSPVVEPIVFHVDRGVPEPVRAALIEGAGWWAAAFEQAGFVDAFRVELLPEGAHPLDVRFNVIEWVHRSTRGWSYGGGVIDPRTGEILKGHVRLGSLRVRQDRLLFEGLVGTDATGTGKPDDPVQLALARIRQLAAHEVGHALGLAHNFAASTYAGRASVMDYPAPLVRLDATGRLDFSRAYGIGVGAWDRHAIELAYREFPPGTDEQAALDALVRDAIGRGFLFLTDPDARPPGASDPRANLWDNGDDPVAALRETLEVREHALRRFGEANVAPGTPLAHLEEVLAPVYFHHRYQLDAALKVVGGMEYAYAVRGDGQRTTRIVPAARQRDALAAVLEVLDPAVLDLPDETLELLAPRPHGSSRNREMFSSGSAPAFDAIGAAATAAAAVVDGLLRHERMGRLLEFHRRDATLPAPDEVLSSLIDRVFGGEPAEGRHLEIARVVQSVVVARLIGAANDGNVRSSIRAGIESALESLVGRLAGGDAHARLLSREIERFLHRPAAAAADSWSPAPPPPGSPIGDAYRLGGCGHEVASTP